MGHTVIFDIHCGEPPWTVGSPTHTPGLFSSRSNHSTYLSLTAVTMLQPAQPPPGSTGLEGILADSGACVPCAAMKWKWRFAKTQGANILASSQGLRLAQPRQPLPSHVFPFSTAHSHQGMWKPRGRKSGIKGKDCQQKRLGESELPISTTISILGLNDEPGE